MGPEWKASVPPAKEELFGSDLQSVFPVQFCIRTRVGMAVFQTTERSLSQNTVYTSARHPLLASLHPFLAGL